MQQRLIMAAWVSFRDQFSDETVEFPKGSGLDHKVRVICICINPHTSRGGSSGVYSDGIPRIATNLLNVPAEIIRLIFAYRWAVEIFLRFFKPA